MGEMLDYVIDTNLQAGTFWMHGHYLGQYVDGLRSRKLPLTDDGNLRIDAEQPW